MILHPIIDLLKRIVVALPDYGGGGSLPGPLVSYESITLNEGFTGTAQQFFDLYLPTINTPPYPTIVEIIENTSTENLTGAVAIRASSYNGQYSTRTFWRVNNNSLQTGGPALDFNIGANSVIHKFTFMGV